MMAIISEWNRICIITQAFICYKLVSIQKIQVWASEILFPFWDNIERAHDKRVFIT